MFKVKLSKLSDNTNEMRTNDVVGQTFDLPEIGSTFLLFGESLENKDPSAIRLIRTSRIEAVTTNPTGSFTFRTLNSEYKLELL